MTDARLPHSWKALATASLFFGVVEVVGVYLTLPFRRGLDADLNPMLLSVGPLGIATQVLIIGAFGAVIISGGRLLANRAAQPVRAFVTLLTIAPALLEFAGQLWFVISAALEPPSSLAPFPSDSLSYPPNWLTLLFIAGGFWLAAITYASLASAQSAELP